MKIDEREMQKNNSNNKNGQRQKRTSGLESIVKGWDKPFCCAFKLGLLQLICKAFLIFKSNLELALSIILKGRELYESEHVAVECRCLKIWHFLSFFIYSLILVFKWQVSPI